MTENVEDKPSVEAPNAGETVKGASEIRYMDVKDVAKLLRKDLAEKFPNQKFSVRIDRYSLGEAIDIIWVDGVATEKVQEVAWKYDSVDRDLATGEILAGGNRYVQCHRRYSEGLFEKVQQEIRAKFVEGTFKEGYDPNLQMHTWRTLQSTDYPTK